MTNIGILRLKVLGIGRRKGHPSGRTDFITRIPYATKPSGPSMESRNVCSRDKIRASLLVSSVRKSICIWIENPRSHASGKLQPREGRKKRRRIYCRHPNSRFVDLEEVSNQRIEIDVGISKIIERQFFPIPRGLLVDLIAETFSSHLHLKLRIQDLHIESMFNHLLLTHTFGFRFVALFITEHLDFVRLR